MKPNRPSVVRLLLAGVLLIFACEKREEQGGSAPDAPAVAQGDDGKPGAEAPESLPKAEEILGHAVEAVGGRAKVDRIASFYYKGQVSIVGQNMGGPIEIWWKDGDFFTSQEMRGVGRIKAGKQGDTIWSQDPINGLRRLSGPEAEQHLWASSRMLAADWKDYFDKATTLGQRDVDGKAVFDVELESGSGAKLVMTFDQETRLQVGQKFDQVTPMGPMPIEVKMDDYRTVEPEGIKIAFRQVTDAKLMKATQEISEIKMNVEVDTQKFAMPSAGAEVVRAEDMGKANKDTAMPMDEDGKPGKPVPKKE